jgi:hypothetical protein
MFFTVNQLSVLIQSMFFSPSVPNYGFCTPWTGSTFIATTDTVSAVPADPAH